MLNPFAEPRSDDFDDAGMVEQALGGNRAALENLILRHQAWIYNIAIRMVYKHHDAEEVTQEVLIKAITHLSTFQRKSKFRTWLYQIAANHVLNMKRRGPEVREASFTLFGSSLDNTPDLDLPDPKSVPVDLPLLVEEAKIGCTTAMLLCLDRKQRLIFILGEILGVSDAIGSEILEMTADNFRQCLARARRDLYSFMNGKCGLVNSNNPCRCPKKTKGFINDGHVDPHHLVFAAEHVQRMKDVTTEAIREFEEVVYGRYAAIYRDHPFLQPKDQIRWLRQILDRQDVRAALHFN